MWKRLNTKDRQFDRAPVESPTLVETNADQDIFRHSASISNGAFSISSRPAFGRKGTGDVLKELPAPPFHSLQISGLGESRPLSEVPTASSIYSQPSPEMVNTATLSNNHPPRSSSLHPDDVSPPESLHTQDGEDGKNGRDSPNVSPISDSFSHSSKQSPVSTLGKYNSNLPVPKKTRKFWNRPSLGSPEQGSNLTHWDVYSGEPTTSEKGKPPSTTPSTAKLHADPNSGILNGYGTSTHVSAGTSNAGTAIGRKRVASRDLNNTPIVRPEWRGAGGRHKIVNPMFDKPLPPGKSATFPQGSEKYLQEQREKDRIAEEALKYQQDQLEKQRMADQQARRQQEQLEEQQRIADEQARRQQEQIEEEHMAEEKARQLQEEKEIARLAEQRARQQQEQRETERLAEQRARQQREQKEAERIASENLKRQQGEEELASERIQGQRKQRREETIATQQDVSPASLKFPPPRQSSYTVHPFIMLDKGELDRHKVSHGGEESGNQTPPASRQQIQFRNSSLMTDDTRSPLARNPSNEEMNDRRSQALPDLPPKTVIRERSPPVEQMPEHWLQATPSVMSYGNEGSHDSSQIESRFRANLQHMNLQDEPPSRFSTTTYATTNQDSPPATPEIGPDSPALSTTPNSILNRKRPVAPAGIPNSRAAARKPTPSQASVASRAPSESKRKSLPKSPPEVNAVSRVAALQAKVDNLRRRRGNLQTVIHELTHVVQPSSIAYDMASRQEIKRTVEGLNKELAEVKKDEHETGLKLHRAMKRDDEFAAYEPTSIWVRRVTS